MGQLLKNVVAFTNVAAAGQATLPHGLNVQDHGVVPDEVKIGNADFSFVSANATSLTVQNNGAAPANCDVLVEHWHTVERSFGELATSDETALNPQPFVTVTGGATGGGGGGFVPQGGPNLVGQVPDVRSGRAVFVNPADPTAADDGNPDTPKLTITGAIAAIVAAGPPTNLATSMQRWVLYVAAGNYDEDVLVPVEVPHLTIVAMGGVTLGDGDATIYGDSTTPRNLTWELNNAYKFANDPFNNPQPPSYLQITTLSRNNAAAYWGDQAPSTSVGFDATHQSFRVSGNFTIQNGVAPQYEDFYSIYADSLVVEGDTQVTVPGGSASAVWTLENSIFRGLFDGGAYIADANNCLFGQGNASGFVIGTAYRMANCKFNGTAWEIISAVNFSGAVLTNCWWNANTHTLVAWSGTLQVDADTLFNLAALGRTIVAYATSGDLICVDTPSVATFGNTDVGAAAGDVFLTPGFQAAAAGATNDKEIVLCPGVTANDVCVIQGISVRHNIAAGNGNSVTYEVRVNGNTSIALPVTVALATGATGQNTSSAKPGFLLGATRMSVRATKPGGGIGSGVINATVTVRYYVRSAA